VPSADPSGALVAALRESLPELAEVLLGDDQSSVVREWLLSRWAAALEADEDPRHVLFHAGPGFGKTVASAQYALRVTATGQTVAAVFFRSGYAALEDPLGVVERLSAQLAGQLPGFREEREVARQELGAGNPIHVTHEGDLTVHASHVDGGGTVIGLQIAPPSGRPIERAWRCDIADPLRALHDKAALPRVVILADGLDETSAPVLRMLADGLTLLPEPVRILMTARPGTELPIRDPVARASVRHMTPDASGLVGTEPTDARQQDEELIARWTQQRIVASRGDQAWASQMARRVAAEADRTFLVALHTADDLARRFPAGTTAPPADEVALPTGGLAGIYDSFLSRVFGDHTSPLWRTRGRPVLGLLSIARDAGLTMGMLSGASGLDGADIVDALRDCGAFIRGEDTDGTRVWRIWHRTFGEHLHDSDAFAVRPWDWHFALGASLGPLALEPSAATVGQADYRRRYATQHAAVHLIDAAADPEGIAHNEAATSLQPFVSAGRWVEALVALAGPVASAAVIERLAPFGSSVPLPALADALRADAHVLTGEAARSDGFTIGQLSVRAARAHDQSLTANLESWSQAEGQGLVAAWTAEAAPPGRVLTTHPPGITAMAVVERDGQPTYLTAGLDGRVRAWSPVTGQAFTVWEDPARRPVSALATGTSGDDSIVVVGTHAGVRVLRWPPGGRPVQVWAATDGPVYAALAVHLRADLTTDAVATEWILVTSHANGALKARNLMSGETAGGPLDAPMPVGALEAVHIPTSGHLGTRTAVVAASTGGAGEGRALVWDPIADRTMAELWLDGLVSCLAGSVDSDPALLAVGYHDGRVCQLTLVAHEDAIEFNRGPPHWVGRTQKASVEAVSALGWTRDEVGPVLVVGDTAGRIHRLDPAMGRSVSWIPGHASMVASIVSIARDDQRGFLSAGSDGSVKSWLPQEISGDAWHEQVLALDVVDLPGGPPGVACGHANGEISLRSARNGELLGRHQVHTTAIWALAWCGPRFGVVSGDTTGRLTGTQVTGPLGPQSSSGWPTAELEQFMGQVASVAPGIRDGEDVVTASALYGEIAVVDVHGRVARMSPFGGIPLAVRLVTTGHGTVLVIDREVPPDATVITGEPHGRQLQVTVRIPTGDDASKPDWRVWWDDPEMLGAWDVVGTATDTDGAHALILAGLRDGAVLVFDLDQVVADPNQTLQAYQVHEVWPHRAAISTLAATPVDGALVIAWTTVDGWLFVLRSWEEPPLRLHLGSRTLVSKVAEDGTIFLGGTNGVIAVRVRWRN
jgi:hypothetical protein